MVTKLALWNDQSVIDRVKAGEVETSELVMMRPVKKVEQQEEEWD